MVTHASRNIGLRQQRSGRPGDPVPPAAFGNAPSAPGFPMPAPNPFGDDTVAVPPAALGNAPGVAPPVPAPNPGDVVLGANRDPARALPAMIQPTLDVANPPIPPPRPSGLGGILAGAVQPASVPYPPPRPTVAPPPDGQPAAQPFNPFVQITAQNSSPNDRFRPQVSALDLSRLFGGR